MAAQVANVQGDPIPGVFGYGVELGLDSAGNVGGLIIYKGTAVAQELVSCTPSAVARTGEIGTIASADLNFDTFGDLLLQVSSKNGNATFCVWLFDPKSKQYVASPELSRLVNPRADQKTRTVVAFENLGCFGSCYDKQTYSWVYGKLTMTREMTITEAINAPSGASSGCSYVRSIKELQNGKLNEIRRDMVDPNGASCEF